MEGHMFTLLKPTAVFKSAIYKSENSFSIRESKYKKLLYKMDKQWTKGRSNSLVTVYTYDGLDRIVLHITDEKLSRIIYKALKARDENFSEYPSLKFITIDKLEKAVFAVYEGRIVDSTPRHIFENLVSLADSFKEFLGASGENVYIHYPTLYLLSEHDHWINALFMAMVFEPVTLAPSDIDIILSIIFVKSDYYTSYKEFKYSIANSSSTFYEWLRMGVFIESNRRYSSNIPFELEINIIRYTLDNNYITDLHDLFNYGEDVLAFKKYDRHSTAFIIDEKRFEASVKQVRENDDFLIYEDNDNITYAKVKNEQDFDMITSKLKELNDLTKVSNYSILVSTNIGKYLYFSKSKERTLKGAISICYASENNLINLIKTLDDWGRCKNKIKKFWFYKDTDFLTSLLMDRIEYYPTFGDILSISFNETEKSEPFNYKYVMFLAIREYLSYNKIDVKDIYTCEFAKILHPVFMKALIQFINSGIVTITPQDDTFNGLDVSQVEFVENLPTNDSALLSKVAFFKDYIPESSLKVALKSVKDKEVKEGCINLDECLGYISSREISKNSLKNIFANPNLRGKTYLVPLKVIISKSVTISGNYKIIGVIWNYGRLKNAYQVIKSNTLHTQEAYVVIHSVLETYIQYDRSVLGISPTSNHLLISLDSKMPVLYEPELNYNSYKSNGLNPREYYLYFLDLLDASADFKKNYDVFEYNDLVKQRNRTSYTNQVGQFLSSVLGMSKCKFHNHWHLRDEFCPICKNTFQIVDAEKYETAVAFEDKAAKFYRTDGSSLLYVVDKHLEKKNFVNEVRVALENNLYDGFQGIRPTRLIQLPTGIIANKLLVTNISIPNIIPLDSFKHVQRLKAILVMYKKLLPKIQDQSFISSHKEIFETMMMHKDFKGEILIPNLALLDSSAILSTDTILKKSKAEKTLEIFKDYLLGYMFADDYLAKVYNLGLKKFVAIVEDIKACKFDEAPIKSAIETYKNFCFTHMQPFATSRTICPVCNQDGIKLNQITFKNKAHFTKLSSQDSDFDGGEADIYPYEDETVQKIFKPHVDLAFKSRILAKAMQRNPLIDEFNRAQTDIRIISASTLLYMKEGGNVTLKGFVQEFVKDSYKISNLKDKDFVKEHGYTRKQVVEILIKVCKGIEFLHSIGGFIGDLNGGNVLIRGTDVFIIDIDGMSFDDVKNCMYTNMYIYPPSAESGNITAQDDWYSLAVQSFYYLTYSHPFRGISVFDNVPANETERMKQGLSVLGEHHIMPPSISIGWDFLPASLTKYFLETFEGKKRESMLSILKEYLIHLKKCDNLFIPKQYERPVKAIVTPDVYVDNQMNLIFKERVLVNINGYDTLSVNELGVLVVVGNMSYFFDIKSEKEYRVYKRYANGAIEINSNALYYTSNNKCDLFVDEFNPETGEIKTHTIKKPSNFPILNLSVDEGDKFVFVEDNTNKNTYDVYCNSSKVYSISKNKFTGSMRIGICYDELSRKRIVLFKEDNITRGIVIEKDSEQVTEFTLNRSLSSSLSFYGSTLYYVGNGNIYFYNVNSGSFKSIECEYAKKDSNIYRFANKFIVTNQNSAYVYEKS